ncbi:MAG: 50S ribosomal protein L4 [Parcubacteria group bacterium GW2011_GWA2_47_8]|nr:MAG: 50S ribosomal protein L4 [Parcubacteria group bacterium GW2011_GWA2_47_8]
MKTTIYTINGDVAKENVVINESIFNTTVDEALLHQSVRIFEANQRTLAAHVRDRREVRGGGKKPWRQKGTGRARAGSNRSPLWIGGGKAHGARNTRSYKGILTRNMRQLALFGTLTRKLADKELFVVESLGNAQTPLKTKTVHDRLASFVQARGHKGSFEGTSIAIITNDRDDAMKRATRNIPNVTIAHPTSLHPHLLLTHRYVIVTTAALETINAIFSQREAAQA